MWRRVGSNHGPRDYGKGCATFATYVPLVMQAASSLCARPISAVAAGGFNDQRMAVVIFGKAACRSRYA